MVSPAFFREGFGGEKGSQCYIHCQVVPSPDWLPRRAERWSKVLSWREKASSPGTEVSGLGAWALQAGREVGRIGWALASSQFPGQRRSPVLAAGGSDGLGPGSGVDLAKVKSHHLFSLGLSLPIFPGAAQLGIPRV